MASAKEKGTDAEHRAEDELTKQGYMVVRSAASATPMDLVAINGDAVRLIQVKRDSDRRPLYPSEIRKAKLDLLTFDAPSCVTREIWIGRVVKNRFTWILKETFTDV